MVKLGKTFNAIKPLLKMQGDYLKNFLGLQQNEDAASKESETRRYISRICEITLSEITDLIAIGEGYFSL